jgi:hypothetical protein
LLADLQGKFGGRGQGGNGGDGEVRTTRDSIGHYILAAFQVKGLVFETLEKEGPASRTTGEKSLRLEMTERGMIGVQCERATLEVDSPLREGVDYGEEFLFVGRVVPFSGVHFSGGEGDRLESVALVLLENGTDGKAGCISGDNEGEEGIRDTKDRGASQGGLQGVKGVLCLRGPEVGGVLVCELGQRGGDAGVVGDETTVVIANAKEGLQFFQCLGDGPGLDGLDLLGVGGDALVGDDVAEIGHGGFEELALGDLAVEFVLPQEGEDLSDVFAVVLVVLAKDEDVVDVHDDRLIEEGAEDVLN